MPGLLNAESTLTDRYQTTVPSAVRSALSLKKHDKIRYTVQSDGCVVLERAGDDSNDPALVAFLDFLAQDIANHPARLHAFDASLKDRLQSLVSGVDLDLDAPLSPDDE